MVVYITRGSVIVSMDYSILRCIVIPDEEGCHEQSLCTIP
jgi:hypothetical protein